MGYDAAALKAEAEKASIMKKSQGPIPAAIEAIMSELEYLSLDIGRLDEVTKPVQELEGSVGGEGDLDQADRGDGHSPLLRQLRQIQQMVSVQRTQVRRIAEVIQL